MRKVEVESKGKNWKGEEGEKRDQNKGRGMGVQLKLSVWKEDKCGKERK